MLFTTIETHKLQSLAVAVAVKYHSNRPSHSQVIPPPYLLSSVIFSQFQFLSCPLSASLSFPSFYLLGFGTQPTKVFLLCARKVAGVIYGYKSLEWSLECCKFRHPIIAFVKVWKLILRICNYFFKTTLFLLFGYLL